MRASGTPLSAAPGWQFQPPVISEMSEKNNYKPRDNIGKIMGKYGKSLANGGSNRKIPLNGGCSVAMFD